MDACGGGWRSRPWRQQAILGRGYWDADALRDILRDYALETLADPDAVLVLDETGFLKRGKASCGVGRHYTGSAGKITNCQIGVFASYVLRHGHAFIAHILVGRALYLPKGWADDRDRLAAAHVPQKRSLCHQASTGAHDDRAGDCSKRAVLPQVAADSVYDVGGIEMGLRRAATGYVPGVNANHSFRSWGKLPGRGWNGEGHR